MLLLLVRHALTDWTGERLSGWTPGIPLSDRGREQAATLVERLRPVPIDAVYSSPIERCVETVRGVAGTHGLRVRARDAFGEVRYGEWEGRRLMALAKTKAWQTVKGQPSAMHFPGGEALRHAQARAVDAVEELIEAHRRDTVLVGTHADLIRLLLAHYLGVHLDLYQRLTVAPVSISAVRLGQGSPVIMRVNDTGDLASFRRKKRR